MTDSISFNEFSDNVGRRICCLESGDKWRGVIYITVDGKQYTLKVDWRRDDHDA